MENRIWEENSQGDQGARLDLGQISDILDRIRTHGSLLLSACLASYEHEDWTAVLLAGRMIMEDAQQVLDEFEQIGESGTMIQKDVEKGLDLSDNIEALTEADLAEVDNDHQTQETRQSSRPKWPLKPSKAFEQSRK